MPDRSRGIDHEKLWPDPLSCPDWPLVRDGAVVMGITPNRRNAEQRLQGLAFNLNRGRAVHVPSPAEREAAFGELFVEGTAPNWRWPMLGFANYAPVTRSREDICDMMLEAAHIRGWLRKQDALEQRSHQASEAGSAARERAFLDGAPERLRALRAELASAEEAERRHLQRLEDERAANRCVELRHEIDATKRNAQRAAQALGVPAPDLDGGVSA